MPTEPLTREEYERLLAERLAALLVKGWRRRYGHRVTTDDAADQNEDSERKDPP